MRPSAEVLGDDGDHPHPPGWVPHPLHLRGVCGPLPGAHAGGEASLQAGENPPSQVLSALCWAISRDIYGVCLLSKISYAAFDA